MANKMANPQEIVYAVVGIGDLAIEKATSVTKLDGKSREKLYKDFVKRGRGLSKRIQNSAPTKQAIAQTKTARTQVKAAATSVTKAVRANAKATRSATAKAAKAS